MFENYLLSHHREDLLEVLKNPDNTKHYSIDVNFLELLGRKIELGNQLLNNPEDTLEEWEDAALSAQSALLREIDEECEIKDKIHCRIHCLAHLGKQYIFPGNKEVGRFWQIQGTVTRISAPKCLEYQRKYICAKCKTPIVVGADFARKYQIEPPVRCENSNEGCNSTKFLSFGNLNSENCKDYQEIKVQELVKKLEFGSIPSTMKVTLEDDLVNSCQPGDDVTICGIVKRQWGELILGKSIEIDLVFKANHLQVASNISSFLTLTRDMENVFEEFWNNYKHNPLEGRDVILKSFCPELYGLYPTKLAMAVVLAGGCPIEITNLTEVHTRSEAHLLLIGDPGTGKSHMLRFASKLIPRSILTTGIGSTAAGLTVTALKENGEWQMDAGALVLADGGICCIDEFNSMKEHDRTTIHEAMEQQTISVAKASIVCKLNTRCSILAACNPKGNIDLMQPLSMNVALPSPLLSRFDLVYLLKDTVNEEWDEKVVDFILNDGNQCSKLTESKHWSLSHLQTYFRLIKTLKPKLTDEARSILNNYYNIQRRLTCRNKARTTVRLLESLVRLSQGHARLMCHKNVEIIDSVFAVFLVDTSMDMETSIFNLNVAAISTFPEHPKMTYYHLLETISDKLQAHDILQKEMDSLQFRGETVLQSRFFATERNQKEDQNYHNDNVVKETEINNFGGEINNVQRVEIVEEKERNELLIENENEIIDKTKLMTSNLDMLNCIKGASDDLEVDWNMEWDKNSESSKVTQSNDCEITNSTNTSTSSLPSSSNNNKHSKKFGKFWNMDDSDFDIDL
ncbi:unnamed protein product [Phyllotreta striolata]|uniref:DNA helicase MCM9 n=1 Tax=Phyllotreta striolata TaxID=444603 RepID=A0A9N9XJ21_PHYSR|nr:unnamed protein product [Phyllotreta striolata]